MSVTKIFLNIYTIKLFDCNNVIDYTSHYKITFDKPFNILNNKL